MSLLIYPAVSKVHSRISGDALVEQNRCSSSERSQSPVASKNLQDFWYCLQIWCFHVSLVFLNTWLFVLGEESYRSSTCACAKTFASPGVTASERELLFMALMCGFCGCYSKIKRRTLEKRLFDNFKEIFTWTVERLLHIFCKFHGLAIGFRIHESLVLRLITVLILKLWKRETSAPILLSVFTTYRSQEPN